MSCLSTIVLSRIWNAFFLCGLTQASGGGFATRSCAVHTRESPRTSHLARGKGVRLPSALFLAPAIEQYIKPLILETIAARKESGGDVLLLPESTTDPSRPGSDDFILETTVGRRIDATLRNTHSASHGRATAVSLLSCGRSLHLLSRSSDQPSSLLVQPGPAARSLPREAGRQSAHRGRFMLDLSVGTWIGSVTCAITTRRGLHAPPTRPPAFARSARA
jgi:hypothetical protein